MLDVRRTWAVPALLVMTIPFLGCKSKSPDTKEAPKTEVATPDTTATPETDTGGDDTNCTANATWVTNPSPPKGAEFSPTSNCTFHQFAYQTFLWLMSPDKNAGDGSLVFEGFANPNVLFQPDGPVGSYPGKSEDAGPTMLARMAKSQTTVDIEDIFQAGPGNKALIDQAGNIVYYANHLNETYWDFIDENQLYKLDVLQTFDPTANFPVNSLELKTSWRIAQIEGQEPIIPDAPERFFVVEAEVPTVTVDDKGVFQEDPNTPIKATMALVAMHVVGVVQDHPEFLWATFEHVDNAPDCERIKSKGDPSKPWSFYDGKATMATANQFDVSDPQAVVNVCLVHPFGGGSNGNQNAIKTLNTNVKAIEGNGITSYYVLGGTVWTTGKTQNSSGIPVNNGAFSPTDADNGARQLGSVDLANTTMETFTQNDNCFACHNGGAHEVTVGEQATQVGAKHINLSHFVVNYQAAQQVPQGE